MILNEASTSSPIRWWRLPTVADDRGSMPMALLVVLVGMAFSALLVPMVLTQDQSTRFDTSRVRSLHAAQAGIDVATGLIRSAMSTDTTLPPNTGSASELPCGPLSGNVSDGGADKYTVAISYYTANPFGHDDAWLGDSANRMICISGYGVYLKGTAAVSELYVPSFALLTSTGTGDTAGNGASPGRTLQSTYVFQTSNSYSAASGGAIRFPVGSANYCMDAGASPVDGSLVLGKSCPTDGQLSLGQAWYYNLDLSIQLVRTKGNLLLNSNGNGLCLQVSGSTIRVNKCPATSTGTAATGQEWRSDQSSRLISSSGACLTLPSATSGVALTSVACGSAGTYQAIAAAPTVGAGAAGAATNQLVNFAQFGRCLDVPNKSVNDGSTFMIIYPCKQKLDLVDEWNQKFTPSPSLSASSSLPTVVQLKTTPSSPSVAYCLKSPATPAERVTVAPCTTPVPNAMKWTYFTTQDAAGAELRYADKFTIREIQGDKRCLGAGPDLYASTPPSNIAIVAPCDGSAGQKWDSDPNVMPSRMQNTVELPFRPAG